MANDLERLKVNFADNRQAIFSLEKDLNFKKYIHEISTGKAFLI
jgi:hypothetical protein